MAIRLVDQQRGRVSRIFAASRPHHSAQAKVSFIEGQNVEEVADFGSASECQNLVYRQVRLVQAISEDVIRLCREEAKGGIMGPVEAKGVRAALYRRSVKPYFTKHPFNGATSLP